MNLQNAGALAWFLPLAAILVALYLLRMRRRDLQVPAVFLWPQRTEEVRANTLFQKLRFSWLLILQLLALAIIVGALARPQFRQKGLAGKVTVVVLDSSASMGATDVAPNRLEVAKQLVSDMIQSASAGDRLALIEAGPTPRVVFPLANDPQIQTRGLSTLRQYDAESDMGEALRLASAIAGATEGAKIVVLSDGAFDRVDDFSPGKAVVTFKQIGKSSENIGILALGTSKGSEGTLAYCGVKNFGVQPAKTGVSVYADGKIVDSSNAAIAPGQTWGKTIKIPPSTKLVEARLDAKDALRADDYAVSLTDPSASARVLLVTKGDMFLERALALDPRVTLDKSDRVPESERVGTGGSSLYDIVVFDGVTEVPVKARGILNFGAAGKGSPVSLLGEGKGATFVSSEGVPLMDGVDLDGVYIERFQRVSPAGAGRAVSEAKQGPLVVVANGAKRQVYVAFTPLDSDFPLNVGFPVLVGNALDFLIGKENSNSVAIRASQPFAQPAEGKTEATLTPDGRPALRIPSRDDRFVIRETDRVGKYTLAIGNKTKVIYATLRSQLESAIEPRANLEVGTAKVAAVSDLTRFDDFWQPMLLIALLVLGIEWWVYARRS